MGARNVSNYVHKDDFSYLTAIWQVLWTGKKRKEKDTSDHFGEHFPFHVLGIYLMLLPRAT